MCTSAGHIVEFPGVCSAELAMADGSYRAAALKTVAYATSFQQHRANAELAALHDVEGCCYFSQCLAVFVQGGEDNQSQRLIILSE